MLSGAKSPQEAVEAWMADERYCDVLMNEHGAYVGMARQDGHWVLVTADILEADRDTAFEPDEPWKEEVLELWVAGKKAGSEGCDGSWSTDEPVVYSEHLEAIALYKALDVEYTGEKGWRTSDNADVGALVDYMLPDHWPGLDLLVHVGKDGTTPEQAFEGWRSQRCWIFKGSHIGFARKGNAWSSSEAPTEASASGFHGLLLKANFVPSWTSPGLSFA